MAAHTNDRQATGMTMSRRSVVSTTVKLAYAVPVVAGSYQLGLLTSHAQSIDLISGRIVEELSTCTPTPFVPKTPSTDPTPTATSENEPTPTATNENEPTPTSITDTNNLTPTPTVTPGGTDDNDDDDLLEILSVQFLPSTGDGGSLALQGVPSCS